MPQQQDAHLAHVVAQTLASLGFLQSQNLLLPSRELDHIKHELELLQLSPSPSSTQSHGLSLASSLPIVQSNSLSNHANSPAGPSLPPRRSYNNLRPEDRSIALWDYTSPARGDLSFRKDDIVIIDEEVNPEWYRGHLEAQPSESGLFPFNYVQRLQLDDQPRNDTMASYQYPQESQSPYGMSPLAQTNTTVMTHYQPPPPPLHYQNAGLAPSGSYGIQQNYPQQIPVSTQYTVQQVPEKKSKFKLSSSGMGNTLAHSAVGGLGFGAGSAVAGNIVNAILH